MQDDTQQRIRSLFDRKTGKTQAALARYCDVSTSAVTQWMGGGGITDENLRKAAEFFGVSFDWLKSGAGDPPAVTAHAPSYTVEDMRTPPLDGFTRCNILSVSGSCGAGIEPTDAEVVGAVDFSDEFLRSLPGVLSITGLHIIHSSGDSMEPTINMRSFCLVDTKQNTINTDGIYCIQAMNQIFIKRVLRNFDGSITLISDNKAYPPQTIAKDLLENAKVVGRVVYIFNGSYA